MFNKKILQDCKEFIRFYKKRITRSKRRKKNRIWNILFNLFCFSHFSFRLVQNQEWRQGRNLRKKLKRNFHGAKLTWMRAQINKFLMTSRIEQCSTSRMNNAGAKRRMFIFMLTASLEWKTNQNSLKD